MKAEDWDRRYEAASIWSLEPNAWIAATLTGLSPGAAVDLGAGEGRNAIWLASLGWQVTAVDFSGVGLARGAARAKELGVEVTWVTADATTWVSPQLIDLVAVAYLQLPAAPSMCLRTGSGPSVTSPVEARDRGPWCARGCRS